MKIDDYFIPSNWSWLQKRDLDFQVTPAIFHFKGRELMTTGSKECRVYLMDVKNAGGDDHQTPLDRTPLICNEEVNFASAGIWGSMASLGRRARHALGAHALLGSGASRLQSSGVLRAGEERRVVAFKVEDVMAASSHLTPAWMSRDMNRAEPPVIANGVVYAYGNGENTEQAYAGPRPRRFQPSAHQGLNACGALRARRRNRQGALFERRSNQIVQPFQRPDRGQRPRLSGDVRQCPLLLRAGGEIGMRRIGSVLALFCLIARAADWPTAAGNPQRDGWAKSETAFTKDNVKGLELLYKYKAGDPLTTPIVVGRLITYLGFKEMLVFAGKADDVYSVDADLNRVIWKAQLKTQPRPAGCSGGLTAPVAMAGSSTAIVARAVRPAVPVAPAAPPAAPVRRPARGGEFFAVSSDGYFHILNPSTGEDRQPPVNSFSPGAKASALNVSDGMIYAAVLEGCAADDEGLYAIDTATGGVVSRQAQGGHIAGSAGTAASSDGFVFAQAQNVHGETNDAILPWPRRTLQVRNYFLAKSDVAQRVPESLRWCSPGKAANWSQPPRATAIFTCSTPNR